MAHTIVTDVCEGIADCVDACPVACIDQGNVAENSDVSRPTAFDRRVRPTRPGVVHRETPPGHR